MEKTLQTLLKITTGNPSCYFVLMAPKHVNVSVFGYPLEAPQKSAVLIESRVASLLETPISCKISITSSLVTSHDYNFWLASSSMPLPLYSSLLESLK